MEKTQEFIQKNKENFLAALFTLLRLPSISADKSYQKEVRKTAELVAELLVKAGADQVKLLETEGNPVVYGEKIIDPNLPTVLVYGHYDVQPAVPLELWETPAFEPTIKKTEIHPDGAIFARGSTDDKGQMFMHIAAFQAMLESKELTCNVKFLIEGEEEVGSTNLEKILHQHQEKLKTDVVLISDTALFSNEQPSICVGLRGILGVEVEITGANRDLHSGIYGGAVANPIEILARMLAQLKDENYHITIPNFYEGVEDLSAEERKNNLKHIPFDAEKFKKEIGISDTLGEKNYHILEQTSIRPTLELNGIWGGYQGEGSKTIIPAKAGAKITMRLVHKQNPQKIFENFKNYFLSLAPKAVQVKITEGHSGRAYMLKTNDPAYLAAERAIEKVWGIKPFAKSDGGSIPITILFEEVLQAPSVLLGFGLDTDALHAPNEHFGLFNFYKGIQTIPYFYLYLAEYFKKG